VEDQILETNIQNLSARALGVIERDLQEAIFLHMSRMLGGCTITFEDVSLELDLPMDKPIVTESVVVRGWSDICEQQLGKMSNKFFHSRIEIKWLEQNFNYLDNFEIALERQQYARAFNLRLIGGVLMPDKSQTLVPLIVYATMEMHKTDRVMRQFGFRQTILPSPQYIEELHNVNLQGITDKD
ncbi:hypothetical protein Goshw_015503, partial [Gossypium schwendimanii]|nr:hypothetical protein [Gossypium schwendimanii]